MNNAMQSITFKTIPIFFIILCTAWTGTAVAQPNADDVNGLRQKAYQTFEDFYEQSLTLRLKYDYAGAFVSAGHKAKLLGLAKEADLKLKGVFEETKQLRADIEAYDSDDWDTLYGVTGLWKAVYAGEFETLWLRKRVGYYIAIASPADERLRIADKIIGWCESDKNRFKNAQTKLLKAKASALIGIESKGYKQQAMEIIEEMVSSKQHDKVYFQAMLLRFNIVGYVSRDLLTPIADQIEQSEFSDDFELNAKVAFAGLKVGATKHLDEVMAKWPGSEKLIAGIILDSLYHLEKNGALSDAFLTRQSVSEISLALNAIVEKSPENYRPLLQRLDGIEKFRCSLLSYAMAESYVNDSSALAVEHYIAAATTRNIDKTLSLTKLELAQKGASIAAKLYAEDKKYCGIANRALLFYCRTADIEADAEMVDLYFETLDECLGKATAQQRLERLIKSDGHFADVVNFQIARRKIENDPTKENYVNVIKVLTKLKHHCGYIQNADAILYDIYLRIDEYIKEYPAFIDDCYFIAKRISDCGQADHQLQLVKIEFGVLAGTDTAALSKELEAINDASTAAMRCRARLMQANGAYAKAAKTWKKIYTSLQPKGNPEASYAWWQAKYYELWCVSRLASTKQADIAHAIEVLESSHENIPQFWAEKLDEL